MTTRTRTAIVGAALAATLTLAGCGSSTDDHAAHTPSGTPTTSSTTGSTESDGPVIQVTIKGESVTPKAKRVDAKVGVPFTVVVTSDREGELHVHSTPEQELAYQVGTTTLHVTIDKPGIVDIEDHVADVVVLQVEVR